MVHNRKSARVRSPGQILREDFLPRLPEDLQDQGMLADRLGMSRPRFNEILNGRRPVTLDSALRIARLLGTTPEFWMNAQVEWDLAQARRSKRVMSSVERIDPLPLAMRAQEGEEGAGETVTADAVGLHLASSVASSRAVMDRRGAAMLPYYREFLERRGLLREAERYAGIRSQIEQIENGRPRVLQLGTHFPFLPPGRFDS